MGSSTNIKLPLTVRNYHLCQVVGVLAGEPFSKKRGVNNAYGQTDFNRPAEKFFNPWKIEFDRERVDGFGITAVDSSIDPLSMGMVGFRDFAHQQHSWHLFTESDDGPFKRLMPDKCALAIAIGKRLVTVFGGELQFDSEMNTTHMRVSAKKALLPAAKRGEDPDIAYYTIQNLLGSLAPLSSSEMAQAIKDAGGEHTRDFDRVLLEALYRREAAMLLESSTPPAPKRQRGLRL